MQKKGNLLHVTFNFKDYLIVVVFAQKIPEVKKCPKN